MSSLLLVALLIVRNSTPSPSFEGQVSSVEGISYRKRKFTLRKKVSIMLIDLKLSTNYNNNAEN